MEANRKVRESLRVHRLPVWKLADALGCHENTVLRRLRHELPQADQEALIAVIERISRKENE